MSPQLETTTAREAAYLAVLASLRDDRFIANSLADWRQHSHRSDQDFRLATHIASGAVRMALALDHLARQGTTRKKLSLKRKERALLRCALFQLHMMHGIAPHAAVNESVELAKKYCHPTFAKFLNALLRKLIDTKPTLPTGHDVESLSIRYSYPVPFVEMVRSQHDIETTRNILAAGNEPPPTCVRIRPQGHDPKLQHLFEPFGNPDAKTAKLVDNTQLEAVAASTHYYIQNPTPAFLIASLANVSPLAPKRILDLCASPGGKTVALHDSYPEAALYANDNSPQRITRLKENIEKYGLDVTVSCSPGEKFTTEQPFDLIVIDVPCSNSGTFNKRAEARWRYKPEQIQSLRKTQLQLLDHAATLLAPQGQIWYLTCSICPQENEEVIYASADYGLTPLRKPQLIAPTPDGLDGGFGCILCKA